jgi:hypothetical protein
VSPATLRHTPRMHRSLTLTALLLACNGDLNDTADASAPTSSVDTTVATTGQPTTTAEPTSDPGTTGTPTSSTDPGTTGDPNSDAAQLLALTKNCDVVSNAPLRSDDEDGAPYNIDVCGLTGALFWTADMDIDCDGKSTAKCNIDTDPAFQNQTSATDSKGEPLDAAELPYVVIPEGSLSFDFGGKDIELGTVIAVIYNGQLRFGVFGDAGPQNIIGEASYAMAESLGIDPDPSTGGSDGPVTYIAFTGKTAVVTTMEDHDEAVAIGTARAAELLQNN